MNQEDQHRRIVRGPLAVYANQSLRALHAHAIEDALSGPPPPEAPVPLNGLEQAIDVFTRMLETRGDAAAPLLDAGSPDEPLSPELVLVSPPELAERARRRR